MIAVNIGRKQGKKQITFFSRDQNNLSKLYNKKMKLIILFYKLY